EVEPRALPTGHRVGTGRAVSKELLQKADARTRRGRTPDLRSGQHAGHGRDRDVIEAAVLLHRALPVADVRLVPQLPIPRADDVGAIAIAIPLHGGGHQVVPAPEVTRGPGPQPGFIGAVD